MQVGTILALAGACMANPSQFALVLDAAANDWALLTLMCEKANVNSNSADYDSRSVLHVAAATCNLQAVQGLLYAGANVNVQDRCDPSLLPSEASVPSARSLERLLHNSSSVHHLLHRVC
jgi:hypothetical protein